MDCSLPGSSVGFFRQEYQSGLPCPLPGDVSDPGIESASLKSLALAGRFFTTSATCEAPIAHILPATIIRSCKKQISLIQAKSKERTTLCLVKGSKHFLLYPVTQDAKLLDGKLSRRARKIVSFILNSALVRSAVNSKEGLVTLIGTSYPLGEKIYIIAILIHFVKSIMPIKIKIFGASLVAKL